jgi:hypothetical protein
MFDIKCLLCLILILYVKNDERIIKYEQEQEYYGLYTPTVLITVEIIKYFDSHAYAMFSFYIFSIMVVLILKKLFISLSL